MKKINNLKENISENKTVCRTFFDQLTEHIYSFRERKLDESCGDNVETKRSLEAILADLHDIFNLA